MESQFWSNIKRKIVKFFRYIKTNAWEVTFYVIWFIFLVSIWFYWYNLFQDFRLSAKIQDTTDKISLIDSEIKKIKSTDEFRRYEYAKYIEDNVQSVYWFDTIKSLISIFDGLKNMWSWSQDLMLNDFKVSLDSIRIGWQVTDMKNIYMSWGLIDKFIWFDYIDTITIPSYTKRVSSYEFILDAKIKLNDTDKQ